MSQPKLLQSDVYYTVLTELHGMVSGEQGVRLAKMVRLYLDKAPKAEKRMVNFCVSIGRKRALPSIVGRMLHVAAMQEIKTRDDVRSAGMTQAQLDLCTAFAMGQHSRLGATSPVRHLDPEMLRLVMARGGLRQCSYVE